MADGTSAGGTRHFDALVIGAGFSGLYQLLCLRDRLGLSVQVFEAGAGVGGTWYWNRYPGARCDVESHAYCYTFSAELTQEWEWTERYPAWDEILRYLNYVTDRFDLRRDIRFNTRITSAIYDAASNLWTATTEGGDRYTAKYLISAVGCLSTANVPRIPGLKDFAGQWYHTGEWPEGGVDFTGKRVGMIGTGSTGIQVAPVVAETAAHLTVFQRTANYSIPANNMPLTPELKRMFKEKAEEIRATTRSTPNGYPFRVNPRKALEIPPEERERLLEEAWLRGGMQFRATFQDVLLDKAANDVAAEFIRRKIAETVKDLKKRAILLDIDHPYGAKRPPIDTGYFECFNRDNVSLVDVKAAPIERITPEGIRTADAEYPLDIIIFATGFDAMTGPLLRIDIRGRDGLTLEKAWEAGPRTYLGLQIEGFPNLFTMTGPGSPSVLCVMPVAIEQHAEWIAACIDYMRKNEIATIEPKPDAVDDWVAHVNEAANGTLLVQAKHSWYLGANIPGKPRVFMPYAGGMINYRAKCDAVAAAGYEGFALGS